MGVSDDDYEPIIEILEDILGDYRMHNDYKGQMSFDCPVCSYELKGLDHGDGKGNLEVNYRHNVYKCWACSEVNYTHGSLHKLIKKYGTTKHLKRYELLVPEESFENGKPNFKAVKLPEEFVPFSKVSAGLKLTHYYKTALNYIRKRNITDDMLTKYNIGFCYKGPYANRIIIPSYDAENRLNYFIARSYEAKTKFKYKNPEAQKEIIIFNEYLIDWFMPIYIVEGAFDSIFLPNSIPMLGKVMGEKLFSLLYEKALEVVVVLDGDAWENSQKIYHKLNGGRLFGKVWTVKLPLDKDIADLQGKLDDFKKIQLD
jgi:DNA primase